MSYSHKLGLLLWKNLKVLQRHWIVTIFEILIPLLLFILLAWIKTFVRSDSAPVVKEAVYFDPVNLYNITETFENNIGYIYYAPTNNFTIKLMEGVRQNLSLSEEKLKPLSSESQLEALQNDLIANRTHQLYHIIGVIFGEKDEIPKKFEYKIRSSNSRWRTSSLFPIYQRVGPQDNSELYFEMGFLALQYVIDSSYMTMVKRKENLLNQEEYPYLVQEFPYPSYTEDSYSSELITSVLGEFIMIGFIISLCLNLLKHIVADKKTGVTELMKLMGLTRGMLWFSWLLRVLMVNVAVITVIALLLKIAFNSESGSVIPNSNGLLIWVFLMLYFLAATVFMFFVSTLFYRPVLALCFGAIIWTGSYYVPMALLANYKSFGLFVKLLTTLFPNMAMYWGVQVIGAFESIQIGVNWGNLFRSSGGSASDLRMGHVILMLIFDIFLYSALTWYMDSLFPGNFGVPQPWNFFCTKSFWQSQKVGVTKTAYGSAEEVQKNFEPPLQGLKPGIRIKNLRKTYPSGKVAVDGVTLDIYQDQITALLGHNGAGKTTTMSILTGMLPPTSGSIYVNDYDIRYDLPKVRESLGLCPQHDMLFNELTVIEHFIFFGMLKGLSRTDAIKEAKVLLEQIQLSEKANAMSSQLSGGMKRKVSLGVALIGGSQVVILDEPTSGLDPEARRQIWDLLLSMRGSRTIVITTHFMEEADVLGDRIAIMDHGHVKCYGTSLYLKRQYGAGYLLKLMIREPCDIEKITQVVQSCVSDAKVKSRLGTELSYSLPSEQKSHFPKLFDAVDLKKQELGIVSIGVSITTMEEVFLKVGKMATDDNKSNDPPADGVEHSLEGLSRSNSLVSLEGSGPQKSTFILQQLEALFIKKMLFMSRKWMVLCIQALIPILLIAAAVKLGSNIMAIDLMSEPALPISLAEYGSTDVFYSESSGTPANLVRTYEAVVRSTGSNPIKITLPGANVSDALIKEGDKDISYFREKLVIAAEFGPKEGNVMYSSIAYHGVSISLNVMNNAILKTMTNSSEYSITVVNHPLKYESLNFHHPVPVVVVLWQQFIPMGLLYLLAYFLIFPLLERVSNAKQLQLMTGLSPVRYWFACFICDFLIFMLVALLMVLTLPLFDTRGNFGGSTEIGVLILLLFLYGMSGIPFAYWFSYFSKTSASGFGLFVGVNFLIGGILPIVVTIMEGLLSHDAMWSSFTQILKKMLFLLPQFCFSSGILKFVKQALENNWCQAMPSDIKSRVCLEKPLDPCCGDFLKQSYLDFESESNPLGMGWLLLFLSMDAVLYFVIILLLDYGLVARAWEAVKKLTIKNRPPSNDEIDGDVKIEYARVKQDESDALVVNDLAKVYGWSSTAVQGVTFGVMHGECFGLLGVNGAGKTTTFKMLTGDEIPTRGDAWVDRYKLSKNKTQYLSQIGYCPQFDAFNETLTGREMLQVFARLRGVPKSEVDSEVVKWLKLLGLTEYQDCRCGTYSGGNKRKLSTAMALIGDPPLIFLDEPTSGVDPVARRNLWSVLAKIQKTKHSIVLTSHSMEECEALCTRLAIMVKGQFVCIGENQYLKQKFGQGFTVMIKLKDTSADENQVTNAKEEFKNIFPASVLKDEHKGLLHYHLTDPHIPWKVLFSNMETLSADHSVIEDYTISETTLEQLFLAFAQAGDENTRDTRV